MNAETRLKRALEAMSLGWGSDGSLAVDDFISSLCERLGGRTWNIRFDSNSVVFRIEIPSICLRGMASLQVILVGGSGAAITQTIQRFKRNGFFGRQRPMALFATDSAFAAGSALLRAEKGLILSRSQLGRMLLSDEPAKELRLLALRQIPFRNLIPFTATHPAEGPMFFGRREELELFTQQDNVDYALCGEGLIGKTSLLRQTQCMLRRQSSPRRHRIVEVDLFTCPPEINTAARRIAQTICYTGFSRNLVLKELESFFRRMRSTDIRFSEGPIDLLIDEVDEVLAEDKRQGYQLLRTLRHASPELIRVTFCGRAVAEKVFRDNGNPLKGRVKLIKLAPLDSEDSRGLLKMPLEHLGVRFENEQEILDTALAACSGQPMRIQTWGLEIATRAASRPGHCFTVADLREVEKQIAA